METSTEQPISDNASILDELEKIVEISKEYGIDKCLDQGKIHLDYVNTKLGLDPLQTVLFSQLMERSESDKISLSEIAESVKCSKIRILKYLSKFEELEKRKLIRYSRAKDSISFRVPRDVRDSLCKFNEYRPEKKENLSIYQFFAVLEQLFEEREIDELTFHMLKAELEDLINLNMHLDFCKKIISYNLSEYFSSSLVLLICFCHLSVNNNDDDIRFHDLEFLFENVTTANFIKKYLLDGSDILFDFKLIEFTNNNGFIDNESWRLSYMAKKELLSELSLKRNKRYQKHIIRSDSIQKKELFYNEKESENIQKLVSLLQEENYRKVQDRLAGNGMRKGFACLFSGAPGTGKTETAYQVARETGRNIMMVDISDTKSCWVGESEKKIKEIFDTYRNAVDNSEIAPILLLNEADAIIGKRREFNASSRAVDQMENTVQNIILQEMENLSGILIATTNLTKNMDKAFERRFLYKIEFTKPCLSIRLSIWQSMIPALSPADCETLASGFDLSGGQIENIARKRTVDSVISGGEPTLEDLLSFCRDELSETPDAAKKIGFLQ